MVKHKQQGQETLPVVTGPSPYAILNIDGEEVRQSLIANMGGSGLRPFDMERIKVPAGGTTTWEIPTLEGTINTRELEGVILHWRDVRAYWSMRGSGNAPPDCSSDDGEVGMGNPGGPCDQCPFSQFGSGRDDTGNPTRGQACKSMRLLFILRPQCSLPDALFLPPTSLASARKYFFRLTANNLRFMDVVTRVMLEPAKNQFGKAYSRAVFSVVRRLDENERFMARKLAEIMRPGFSKVVIDQNEFDSSSNGTES